jgi:clavulanate-9-aldehyde reductase
MINQGGGRAIAQVTDVGVEAEARAFVEQTRARLGQFDALVNNAGLMLLGPVADADTDEWRSMIDTNVMGVLYCTRAALPIMCAQRSGHIVNISSVAGRRALAGSAVYSMTKFAVGAFSEALRQEVADYGIRVTLVEAGAVTSELAEHNRPEIQAQLTASLGGLTPLTPDDVARAIVFALAQPANVNVNALLVRPTDSRP